MSSYLQLKKRAFMSIVNGVKGFVRTVSGVPPISLEDCVDSDSLIDWKLYGNSVQDGTPTPEAPVEVQSVGEYDSETGKYKIPVTARGKNLCNPDEIEIGGLAGGDGSEFKATNRIKVGFILVEEGKKYIVSGHNYIFANTHIYDANKTKIGGFKNGVEIMTGGKYVRFSLKKSNDESFTEEELQELKQTLMFEEGTTATDYEPYHAPIQTNIYLDEPLRKVGDYADYVDFGKGEVVRNVSETVFNGSETWTKTSDVLSETYQGFAVSNSVYNIPNDKLVCMSDKFPYSSVSIKNSVRIASGLWGLRIIIGSEYVPDLEGATFKNWLSENNVKIVYPTATSTEENISLPKLPTIKGTTIYEIGTSLNASNMEATYYSTIHNS